MGISSSLENVKVEQMFFSPFDEIRLFSKPGVDGF
jgi:hypothetical protein